MTEELKTLKDIPFITDIHLNTASDLIHSNDLRQEAIKWIKELDSEAKENRYVKHNYLCLQHTIDWIKHFFNIKESDLK